MNLQKILPACAVAMGVALVMATSAFKEMPKDNSGTQTSYEWFQISGSYSPTDQVDPSDATYLGQGTTAPSGMGCDGSTYQCVSGFNANQTITAGGQTLLNGDQAPADVSSEKN